MARYCSPQFSVRTRSSLDEPVSALDVSIRAQIMNQLEHLQQTLGVSYLFIGHDLATVAHISHRIAVMYLGQIIELADSLELCAKPLHPYTQALFTAALPSHPDERHERLTITGEVTSALDPSSGCRFHPRCPHAMPQSGREAPSAKKLPRSTWPPAIFTDVRRHEDSMYEHELQILIAGVKAGRTSRRAFVRKIVGLGLTAPFATQLLAQAGLAQAPTNAEYKPTKAGGGSPKMLFCQDAAVRNPHFAVGTKDQEGSRIFYEPLAAWDPKGNLVPVLAAEIPDLENGGLAPDGMSVTWKLRKDVSWHDGRPFSADDVVFNWEYAADPATAATTIGSYKDLKVEKIDPSSVRVRFDKPTPFWADSFVGQRGMIIPKHLFEPFKGANSRDAPANLKPIGTGPYRFLDFKPGDLVKGERNPGYYLPNRPYFDTIEMKGGGDAVSAE